MLLQLATVLLAAGGSVSAVAVTYVASGPHQQQYSSPQSPPSLVQHGAQQQYVARPPQAGAQQQYLVRPPQPGAQQQYVVRPQPGQLAPEPEDFDPNPQYQFAFDVKDDQFTNYQNRKEQREGDKISGSYSVVDSDGFIRTVKYTADPREGFKAEVTREPTSIVVKIPTPPPALAGLQAQYSNPAAQPHQFAASGAAQQALGARHDAVQHYLQAPQASRVYSSLGQQTPQQFAQQRAVARPQPSLDPQQFLGQQQSQFSAAPKAYKGGFPEQAASAGDVYHGYQQ